MTDIMTTPNYAEQDVWDTINQSIILATQAKYIKDYLEFWPYWEHIHYSRDEYTYNPQTNTVYFVEKYSSNDEDYKSIKEWILLEKKILYLAAKAKAEAARPAAIFIQKIQRGRMAKWPSGKIYRD